MRQHRGSLWAGLRAAWGWDGGWGADLDGRSPHPAPNLALTFSLPSPLPPLPAAQVNASDTRGKADASVLKGVGGKLANSIKEMSTNAAISYDAAGKRKKASTRKGAPAA